MRPISSLPPVLIAVLILINTNVQVTSNEANSVLFMSKEIAGYAVFTKRVQTEILYLMLEPKWQSEWILPKDCIKEGENASAAAQRALKATTNLTESDIKPAAEYPFKPDESTMYWAAVLNAEHKPITVPQRYSDYKWCSMDDVETFGDEPTIKAVRQVNNYLLKVGY